MVGGSATFELYPMPWIAGQSKCQKVANPPEANITDLVIKGGFTYTPYRWVETKQDCKEQATVYWFVDEKFTITTANLVFFGIAKAICNFITGVCADTFGRKWTIVIGWIMALPMPFMVIYANSWWTVALSNLFLGIQQALVWSSTIFLMIDLVGQKHSGTAVGVNETIGYTSQAICTVIAGAILNEHVPRRECYWVLLGIIIVSLLVSLFVLKETRGLAQKEETDLTKRDAQFLFNTRLQWPSGRSSNIAVARSAFVYTSFVNNSLMALCFAGLMINFLSGFAFGLLQKWMKGGNSLWDKMNAKDVSNIVLCYGIFKGVLQFICGFIGDRVGRKWVIVTGLMTCVFALIIFIGVGTTLSNPTSGFFAAASFLGIGTAIMYSTALAAVCDHTDPTWRSSALGAYRFWRDLGYAVGALATGAVADWVGIPWSIGFATILTALSALCIAVFYQEVQPGDDIYHIVERASVAFELGEVPTKAGEVPRAGQVTAASSSGKSDEGEAPKMSINSYNFTRPNPPFYPVMANGGYPGNMMPPFHGPQAYPPQVPMHRPY